MAQRDLVNFSVKAQDQILRAAAEGIVGGSTNLNGSIIGGGYKTTDDLMTLGGAGATTQYPGVSKILNSLSIGVAGTNITTNASQDDPSRLMGVNKSVAEGDNLLLPSIKSVRRGQASPFKGNNGLPTTGNAFFDMPMMLATQKMMRQTVRAAAAERTKAEREAFNPAASTKYSPNETAREMRATHSADRNQSVKMNPKVLETWINETLQDAEHLDIPGVILKPEHKNPISRYGIDRLALTNAGIPNELVDRIFRALFVYSVGFYELVKKCLQHTERKYSIITAIWKVFSILLEYCCKTDYRMLISEISKEHKDEIDRLEKEFQAKFGEQAANERILKQNMEILQKYTEELEKEKNSERQMRLKLEEEYMQNTKNHEEEVQLRLKFESKLNNMHSVHRDLETKYKRALSELAGLQTINEQLYTKNNSQAEEITALRTAKAEMESKISYNDEKIAGLQREIQIKIKQVTDLEGKFAGAQDELDLTKYKLQELQKDLTEQKLKIDVFESQVIGLKNEKQHLLLELKETKDLQKVYEKKCGTLISEVNKINLEFQESKREIIGFGEIQKEREERIDKLKFELKDIKIKFEDLDLKHGTLNIQHDKVKEQYETSKRDLDDAIEKLHLTNKVRHETELKLSEETERARSLQDVIRDKDEQLHKRSQEIEDMDRRVIELERTNENIEIKKASLERQFEITKKQLTEKIQNLNEVLQSEKETREMWIERYEKEQKEHTQTNANLLHAKSQLKDQILATKNVEIKLQTTQKSNEVMTEQNTRLQDQLNEALARQENLERDVNTQKEIMKQMEANRKEYIAKLKSELLTVESRFHQKVEQTEMVSQDYLSRAAQNVLDFNDMKARFDAATEELNTTKADRDLKITDINGKTNLISNLEMRIEELLSYIELNLMVENNKQEHQIATMKAYQSELEDQVEENNQAVAQKKKIEQQMVELNNELKLQKTEIFTLKKTNDKLQQQIGQQQEQLSQMNERQSQLMSTNGGAPLSDQPARLQSQQSNVNKPGSQQSIVRGIEENRSVSKANSIGKENSINLLSQEVEIQTDLLMSDIGMPQQHQLYMQPMMTHRPNLEITTAVSPMAGGAGTSFMQTMVSPYNQTQAYTNDPNMMDMNSTLGGAELGSILQSPAAHQQFQGHPMQFNLGQHIDQQQQWQYQASQLNQNPQRFMQQQQLQQPQFATNPLMQQQNIMMMGQQNIPEMQAEHEDDNNTPNNNNARASPSLGGIGQSPMAGGNYQQQQINQNSQSPLGNNSGFNNNFGGTPMGNNNNFGTPMNNFGGTPMNQQMFSNTMQQLPNNNSNQGSELRQGSAQQQQLQHQNSMSQQSHASGIHAGAGSLHNGGNSVISMQRAPSNNMQVEYKNMSTVMQSQASNHSGNSQRNAAMIERKQTGVSGKSNGNIIGQSNGFSNANNGGVQNQLQQQQMMQNNIQMQQQQQINGNPTTVQQQQQQMHNQSPIPQQQQLLLQQQQHQQYQQQQQQPLLTNQHIQQQQQLYQNTTQPTDYKQAAPHLTQDLVQQIQSQQQPITGNTRLKVDIINSYGSAAATDNQRRQLNSGGAMSVHTPMSQVSGYSQHLAPQSNRFQQQPPTIITTNAVAAGQGNMMMPGGHQPTPNNNSGMQHVVSGGVNANASHHVSGNDRKVTGKSSIRTLIKAAATRDN